MHMCHAQRKHIIHSLDTLLYQLHALSFILSPSLLAYICRVLAQAQLQRPREVDSKRSLRFWYFLILLFNAGSVWSHVTNNSQQGRSVMVDFVGLSNPPSKLHVLSLDFLIITLSMLLTTIAYEYSLSADMPDDTIDPLQPILDISTPTTSPHDNSKLAKSTVSPYVMEIRLSHILDRLGRPPPVVSANNRNTSNDELLPLPNTVPWQLPGSLGLLMRARARAAERARREAQERDGTPAETRTIPGALDVEET